MWSAARVEGDGADRRLLDATLQSVAAGDRAALERLYRLTSPKLLGVCLRILQDRSEAEDVLQEVYVTVWRRAGSFDASRGLSPVTWLAVIARNRAIDRLRARRGDRRRPLDDAASIADEAPLADRLIERDEDARRLADCLSELEPEHAAHVRAAFYGGLTYQALAERADVPLGTMKSWVRRALLRLRGCLER